MKELVHRCHYTVGLAPLWSQSRGKITREEFRQMAREVRDEVKREQRGKLLRYEFLFPDVAHSIDFKQLPRDLPSGARRYLLRALDECTRLTLRRAVTDHKGAGQGYAFAADHLHLGPPPLVFKFDWEFAVGCLTTIAEEVHYQHHTLDLGVAPGDVPLFAVPEYTSFVGVCSGNAQRHAQFKMVKMRPHSDAPGEELGKGGFDCTLYARAYVKMDMRQ